MVKVRRGRVAVVVMVMLTVLFLQLLSGAVFACDVVDFVVSGDCTEISVMADVFGPAEFMIRLRGYQSTPDGWELIPGTDTSFGPYPGGQWLPVNVSSPLPDGFPGGVVGIVADFLVDGNVWIRKEEAVDVGVCWDRSSLEISSEADCYSTTLSVTNTGDRNMAGSTSAELWLGQEPDDLSLVTTYQVPALAVGGSWSQTYDIPQGGPLHYKWVVYQRPGHPGLGYAQSEGDIPFCPPLRPYCLSASGGPEEAVINYLYSIRDVVSDDPDNQITGWTVRVDGVEEYPVADPVGSYLVTTPGTHTFEVGMVTEYYGTIYDCACSLSTQALVPPTCNSWTFQPSEGFVPLSGEGSGDSADPSGLVTRVYVDWGDGSVSDAVLGPINIAHTYGLSGTFVSQLVLVTDEGEIRSESCRAQVRVEERPPL